MTRIEQALRKSLADYGLPMDDYLCHIESVYEHDPKLIRSAIFYRPSDGASITIDDIYTDRGGWPAQWGAPELGSLNEVSIRRYMEADSA